MVVEVIVNIFSTWKKKTNKTEFKMKNTKKDEKQKKKLNSDSDSDCLGIHDLGHLSENQWGCLH